MTRQPLLPTMLGICLLAVVHRTAYSQKVSIEKETPLYGVLLDAGSSSTKVKVFSYTKGKLPSLIPSVRLLFTNSVKPGLGDHVKKMNELSGYLSRTISLTTKHVPGPLQASTPLFVMATAGLRKLSKSDAGQLLSAVRDVLANTTLNPFRFLPEHVSILSGEEEAVYAWLALNYLLGFFNSNMTYKDSVGLLEMGGGSMQIAFLPDVPLYQEEFQVYAGRKRFDLYAQSYLDYGGDYVRRRLYEQLTADQNTTKVIKKIYSPCLLKGDKDKFAASSGVPLEVNGTGDPGQCEEVLIRVLKPPRAALCSPPPCAIGNRYQPDVGIMPFYAISLFVVVPTNLGAIDSNQRLNLTLLRQNAWRHCSRAIDEPGLNRKFASGDCLMGLYIPQLLTSGLGFPMSTNLITTTKTIGNTSIDWATGAMLQQLSMAFMDDLDSQTFLCQYGDKDIPVTKEALAGAHSLASPFTVTSALIFAAYIGKV